MLSQGQEASDSPPGDPGRSKGRQFKGCRERAVSANFRGTYENRLDKKGRVSVPAEFRQQLRGQAFEGIVAFPSLRHGSKHKALECSGADRLDVMSASIDPTKVLPDGTGRLTQLTLGRARDLSFDGEGRVVIPEGFVAYLGLNERVTFVGQGPFFEIWESGAYAQREAQLIETSLKEADDLLAKLERPQ